MITPRITCCKECTDIVPLIKEIDCRLSELSLSAYNNIVYMLGTPVNQEEAISLLFYKRILQYKIINHNYAGAFSVNMIASKIKKYTVDCEPDCTCEEFMNSLGTTTSTTSSTTTLPPTTTTTSTTVVPTTTTTTTIVITTTTTTLLSTTTTTTTCVGYMYFIDIYVCGSCAFAQQFSINNSTPLTVGKWYLNTPTNEVYYITEFEGCTGDAPDTFILNANNKNSCIEVACLITTSTTSSTRTSSTTTTSTTVVGPTTTTTTHTTAVAPFSIPRSVTGQISAASACPLTAVGGPTIFSDCNENNMNVGCKIYSSLLPVLTLFNGNNQWYIIGTIEHNVVQIGGAGPDLGKIITKDTVCS